MQRCWGRRPPPVFSAVGQDAFNAVFSTTFEIDRAHGTHYHDNFRNFMVYVQNNDLTVDGAMTDPKGDRSRAPHFRRIPTCSFMWWSVGRTALIPGRQGPPDRRSELA